MYNRADAFHKRGGPILPAAHWMHHGGREADLRVALRSLAYQLALKSPEYRAALQAALGPWKVTSADGEDCTAPELCGGQISLEKLSTILLVAPLSTIAKPPQALLFLDAVGEAGPTVAGGSGCDMYSPTRSPSTVACGFFALLEPPSPSRRILSSVSTT